LCRPHDHELPARHGNPDHVGRIISICLPWRGWHTKSGYVPKPLGVLIGIAGVGYLHESLGTLLSHGFWSEVFTITIIGACLLALWLVIRRRRITVTQPFSHAELAGAVR
jgi:hypothetical protein